MKYTILQIKRDTPENNAIARDVSFDGFNPEHLCCYSEVAEIEASDLNEVFILGNIGDRSTFISCDPQMCSISVGDVIVDESANVIYSVDRHGFTNILTGEQG